MRISHLNDGPNGLGGSTSAGKGKGKAVSTTTGAQSFGGHLYNYEQLATSIPYCRGPRGQKVDAIQQ